MPCLQSSLAGLPQADISKIPECPLPCRLHLYRLTQPSFTTPSLPNTTGLDWLSVILAQASMALSILYLPCVKSQYSVDEAAHFGDQLKMQPGLQKQAVSSAEFSVLALFFQVNVHFHNMDLLVGGVLPSEHFFPLVSGWLYKTSL